jgi:hypothetical protein
MLQRRSEDDRLYSRVQRTLTGRGRTAGACEGTRAGWWERGGSAGLGRVASRGKRSVRISPYKELPIAVFSKFRRNLGRMKRLLRRTQTGVYFDHGMWVKDWAKDFPDTTTAIKTAAQHHLRDVQLVSQNGESGPSNR